MTRRTSAAPDPAPPPPTRNLKGSDPFRFDLPAGDDQVGPARPATPSRSIRVARPLPLAGRLAALGAHRDRAPFAHLPDTPLVARMRERAVLARARP